MEAPRARLRAAPRRLRGHDPCRPRKPHAPPDRTSINILKRTLRAAKIALLGSPRDGALARHLAAQGARIMASVGSTTTMLVVGNAQPFGRFVHAHADYCRAEELRHAGSAIEIVEEDVLLARIGEFRLRPDKC